MPPKKKKVAALVKIALNAGAATPAPPVGTALGPHGVNIMEFCKAYNAATESMRGTIIPVEITIYEDRTFTFITKTPPAAELIKKAAGVQKGSGVPHREKVGTISRHHQTARPQRQQSRLSHEDRRRHRTQYGRNGIGLSSLRSLAISARTPPSSSPR